MLSSQTNVVRKQLFPPNPHSRIGFQHPFQKSLGLIRHHNFLWKTDSAALDFAQQLGQVSAFEGELAEEHLIEGNPEGPNVHFGVVLFSLDDFGGHVEGRAEQRFELLVLGLHLGKPEIPDLDDVVVEHHVCQLKVSVHNVVFQKDLESIENLDEILEGEFLSEIPYFVQYIGEVALVAVLEDQIEVSFGFEHLEKTNYVDVFADLHHLHFILQKADHFLIEASSIYLFHCNQFIGLLVHALIHRAELSFSNDLQQNVVFQTLRHYY